MTSSFVSPALDSSVEGAVNLRDLGGLPTRSGRIRKGLIYRSGMMHQITATGLSALANDLGVRTIIDFRNQLELDSDGLSDFDSAVIRHVHVPIGATTVLTPDERQERMRRFMEGKVSWSEAYRRMASDFRPSYVTFFETIAKPEVFAAVFHCAAGRDRTGVAAALLLDVLGVDDELIVEDYHATGPNLQSHAHRYSRVSTEIGMSDEEFARLLMTDPAAMTEFLGFLRETYGGAERYLLEGGLDKAIVAEVRGQLSERT